MVERFQNYIGGKFVDAGDGRTFDSLDPYAGEAWAAIPEGSTEDIDHAVAAARSALQGEWGKMTGFQRAALMRRLADLITENAERLARVEVRDNGKLYREMIGQLQGLGAWYQYFAGHADKIEGRVIPTDKPNYFCFTRREPVGVVGAITPWNSPLLLMTFKLAPGLAAGCTFVVKPSEHSPASTLAFAQVLDEAGFPPGVFNVVAGSSRELGAALAGHKGVDKVAFTGSTATGRAVAHAAADNVNRVTLELGGKSPQIVFEDADLAAAANGIIAGVFAATGQTCMAGSRVIVHESVHDELVRLVAERANAIKLGDPNDPETEMGPIANQPQYEKVLGYLDTAQKEGATAACGGAAASELGGFFVKPTLFTGARRRRHRGARGGLRPGDGRADVPHRGGGAQARQRHPVRPRGFRVDPRRAARAPGGRRAPRGHRVDQRLPRARPLRALRRVRAERARPGERRRRPQRVHRGQVRVGGAHRRDPRPLQARLRQPRSTSMSLDLNPTAPRPENETKPLVDRRRRPTRCSTTRR